MIFICILLGFILTPINIKGFYFIKNNFFIKIKSSKQLESIANDPFSDWDDRFNERLNIKND